MQKWFQRSSPKNKGKEEFLATKQITVLEHPAFSPDLAPSDFFLFPKIKEILKGSYFDDIDDIRSNTTAALKAIPQNQFQNCFEGWTRCWHQCKASQGEYFEVRWYSAMRYVALLPRWIRDLYCQTTCVCVCVCVSQRTWERETLISFRWIHLKANIYVQLDNLIYLYTYCAWSKCCKTSDHPAGRGGRRNDRLKNTRIIE